MYMRMVCCQFMRFVAVVVCCWCVSQRGKKLIYHTIGSQASSNSYTMGCPPVRGDNPRALTSGLSYVQVDKHGITILYHIHQ